MPNAFYIKGRAFEYLCMNQLRKGEYYVLRASGSHGPCDLIALKPGSPLLLIQCKRGTARLSPGDWNRLYELATEFHAIALLALKAKRGVDYIRLLNRRLPRQALTGVSRRYDPFGQGVLDIGP